MKNRIRTLLVKYQFILKYTFFGIFTTGLDFLFYALFQDVLHIDQNAANFFSQLISVLASYFTNKYFIFKQKDRDLKTIVIQLFEYFSMRISTIFLNCVLFYALADMMKFNDYLSKIFISAVTISINFFISKKVIFRDRKNGGKK